MGECYARQVLARQDTIYFHNMTREQKEAITWFQFNNIVPIVITAVMIAGSFFLLQTKVSLLEQKLDFIISSQKDSGTQTGAVSSQTAINTLDIRELRTRLAIIEGGKEATP